MAHRFQVSNRAKWVKVGAHTGARVWQALALLVAVAALGMISGCSGVVTANTPSGNGGGTPPPAASFSISPSSLSFGNVTMGGKVSQNATVTNTGNAMVTISQASFSNNEFTLSNMSMPATLDAGQSASFVVWLNGTTAGAASGTLSLMSSDGTSSASVALSGTVVTAQPQLSVTPTAVSFGSVTVGSKGTQTVTLNNTGSGDLSVSAISVSAAGVGVSGIATPATIKAGQSANLTLTYTPTTSGAMSGHISIASNAPNSPLTVNVTGTGTAQPVGQLGTTPATLAFGNINVGSSGTLTSTVTNTGQAAVHISGVTTTGTGFTATGISASSTLNAGASATLTVKFAPSAAGAVSGKVSITSDAQGSPTVISLSGNGAQAGLSVSSTNVSFGNVTVGSKGTQSVTLSNIGSADLTVSLISVNATAVGATGIATPATIKAGQSAALTLTYSPTVTGAMSGSVSITSNAPNSPVTIAVSGTGTTQAVGQLGAAPGSLSFGNVNVGSNNTLTSTLTNTGQAAVHISGITTTGAGFTASGVAAPSTLNPGMSATLSVKFAPTTAGAVAGKVSIASDVQGSPTVLNLTGTGAQAGLGLSTTSLNFGSVITGNSNSQNITITNTGQSTLTITSATVTGTGFSVSGLNANTTLAAGQTLTFSAKFAPTAAGGATGTVSIASNAPGSPATVSLSGTGTAATFTLGASPASVSFGNVNIGSSPSQNVTITNTGNSNVTISSVTPSGTGVTATGIAGSTTVAPGQTAALVVNFAPTTTTAVNGSVKLTTTQGAGLTIAVTGTGIQAGLSATPASASFGSVSTGSSSTQSIQLKNTGTASLTISQASVSGSQEFSTTGLTLPLTITAGNTSSFTVKFAPTASGNVTATLNLTSNAPGSPLAISLSGSGAASTKTITVSPTSLSFGSVNTGTSSSLSVTVTNTGNSTVNIASVSATGTGFSVPNSAVSLTPSQKTTITVQFAPTSAGAVTGTLTISSDATGSPATVSLSGTGATTVQHSVALDWSASTSNVSGYNVYRSTVSGQSYVKVNTSLVTGVNYTDSTVKSGTTYFYVTTAVDSSGNESVHSNEVQAVVP